MHEYKYLPDVIQSLEEEGMEKEEQWKKLRVLGTNLMVLQSQIQIQFKEQSKCANLCNCN